MKRSEETEKRIIQAALELFVRNGYHGTSIKDITNRVSLTKGALYAHFTSKGELLLRILKEFETQFIHQMIHTVSEFQGDAVDKLNRVISFNAEFGRKNLDLCVFLTFLTSELNSDVDFQMALKGVYRKYQKFIGELIAQGIRQGLIKKSLDPEMTALSFISIQDGVLHQWVLNRDHLDGKTFVRTVRTLIMQGLNAID